MNSQKEKSLDSFNITSIPFVRNTYGFLIAVCLSGCTQVTWTTSDYSGPCLGYQSLSDLEKKHQKSAIPDNYNLERLGEFIGAKKEGRYDEFVDDEGNVFTREELESHDK